MSHRASLDAPDASDYLTLRGRRRGSGGGTVPGMSASHRVDSPDIDLGSLEFWGQPADQRDRYFEQLRRTVPISRHEPPEDILGLPDQGRMHY